MRAVGGTGLLGNLTERLQALAARPAPLVAGGTNGPANLPFQGGILCVQPPLKRGPVQSSGGLGTVGCTGLAVENRTSSEEGTVSVP